MRVLSGRYELLESLGTGGMGVVHRARDGDLGRIVAVKVLPSEMLRSEENQARFRREARAAASLAHPNIAVVHDIGVDGTGADALPYLVMELVEGQTLAEAIRNDQPTVDESVEIMVAVLDALMHSHSRSIVHRDIKPSNIMINKGEDGVNVKVMDFGIAKIVSEAATRMTATGTVLGTPWYMSPEQADGRSSDAGSDLYSAGCVLYELLTGRPPFTGESPTVVLFQHIQKPPEPPSSLRADLNPAWDQMLATALAKSPSDRFVDARAMKSALVSALKGEPAPQSIQRIPTAGTSLPPGGDSTVNLRPPVEVRFSKLSIAFMVLGVGLLILAIWMTFFFGGK